MSRIRNTGYHLVSWTPLPGTVPRLSIPLWRLQMTDLWRTRSGTGTRAWACSWSAWTCPAGCRSTPPRRDQTSLQQWWTAVKSPLRIFTLPVPYCNMATGIRSLNKTQLKLNFIFWEFKIVRYDDQPYTFSLSEIVNADDFIFTLRVKTVIYIVQKIGKKITCKISTVLHLKHDK